MGGNTIHPLRNKYKYAQHIQQFQGINNRSTFQKSTEKTTAAHILRNLQGVTKNAKAQQNFSFFFCMEDESQTPKRPSPEVEPNAPAAKRYRGYRARIDTAAYMGPVYTVLTDTEEDTDFSEGSGGASQYGTVTCPSCGCIFEPNEIEYIEEMDSGSSLGTSSGLGQPTQVRMQGGNTGGRAMGDRASPEPRIPVGLSRSSRTGPIWITDDDDSNNDA